MRGSAKPASRGLNTERNFSPRPMMCWCRGACDTCSQSCKRPPHWGDPRREQYVAIKVQEERSPDLCIMAGPTLCHDAGSTLCLVTID